MSQMANEEGQLKQKEREMLQIAKDKGINLEHLESEKKKQADEKAEKIKQEALKKEAKNVEVQKKAVDSLKKKTEMQERQMRTKMRDLL